MHYQCRHLMGGGRTAPGDTQPKIIFCGSICKEQWINYVGRWEW